MRMEICDIDEKNVTYCWAIDAGRVFVHFTSSLSELLSLRENIDIMIDNLVKVQRLKDQKHEAKVKPSINQK